MTKERVCANSPTLSIDSPHSELNPYHQAIYLHALIKSAVFILDHLDLGPMGNSTGLHGLLEVIQERASELGSTLDNPATCEKWNAA